MTNKYLKVVSETPILNTPDFQQVFGGTKRTVLQADEKGHIRALEFIALKNMVFEIVNSTSYPYIYEIKSDSFKNSRLFMDSRFTKQITFNVSEPLAFNLIKDELGEKLTSLLGTQYLWGGNWSRGVEKIIEYYPPATPLTIEETNKWKLKGVDCSGFLFEATNGFTPRNTSELINFKNPVLIEGLSCLEIAKIIKPLDLIVYKGHLIIVLDNQFTIESTEKSGVIKRPVAERLNELLTANKPANQISHLNDFVIRRWLDC